MEIKINVRLDWPTYEEDINLAVKETILDEVRKETRKSAIELRGALAKSIRQNVAIVDVDKLIQRALRGDLK
jgi:hypothetical protein